ncbi:MAG: HD domain-containing protein [Candidatus Bilamarchaeaceae archaeon]
MGIENGGRRLRRRSRDMLELEKTITHLVENETAHPALGLSHCIRVGKLAEEIAEKEGMAIDKDALRIAALLHDFGAYPRYKRDGIGHAEKSAEFAEWLITGKGLAPYRVHKVKKAILGHMYDAEPDMEVEEAVVLHDADILEFLGAVGIGRIYCMAGMDGRIGGMGGAYALLNRFMKELPGKAVTKTGKKMAETRVNEMEPFFQSLRSGTWDARHL